MKSSHTQLIADLSRLMAEYPLFASQLKTARDAVLHNTGALGPHGKILAALKTGGKTYDDLMEITFLKRTTLHRHLKRLIKASLIEERWEPWRGEGGPRKLYFLKKKS